MQNKILFRYYKYFFKNRGNISKITIKITSIETIIIVFLIFFFFKVLSSIFLIFIKLTIQIIKVTATSNRGAILIIVSISDVVGSV